MSRAFSCIILFAALLFVQSAVPDGPSPSRPVLNSLSDLPLDEAGRLASHWLLLPEGCVDSPGGLKGVPERLDLRNIGVAAGDLADALQLTDMCPAAVALEQGTLLSHVAGHHDRYSGTRDGFDKWINTISQVEVGWINFFGPARPLKLYWLGGDGQEHFQSDIWFGEPKTHWRVVFLGHKFLLRDDASGGSGQVVAEFVATKNEIHVVGSQPSLEAKLTAPRDRTSEIRSTNQYEIHRSHQVKRTFTEHGFNKSPVPLKIFGSMSAYYYNNRRNLAREDWGGKGLYVNWWEVDPAMIQPPFGLKTKWHDGLRPLAEEWIGGIELEDTDLYGLRKYHRGAKLLKHVDRESTHAVSMIINIDQSEDLTSGQVAPWRLEIHDHQTDRQPSLVAMQPGEMVFYESAKCLHGRPEPLEGEYYVNLFAHYRPKGDPVWYTESLATAPLDGSAAPLAEVAEARGGHLSAAEGELKQGTDDEAELYARTAEPYAPFTQKLASAVKGASSFLGAAHESAKSGLGRAAAAASSAAASSAAAMSPSKVALAGGKMIVDGIRDAQAKLHSEVKLDRPKTRTLLPRADKKANGASFSSSAEEPGAEPGAEPAAGVSRARFLAGPRNGPPRLPTERP